MDLTSDIKSLKEPRIYHTTPDGLMREPNLTLDEFIPFNPHVQRYRKRNNEPKRSGIIEAAKTMRIPVIKRKEPYSYFFSLSNHEDLDSAFNIPKDIEDIDLFTQYWPIRSSSTYLKSRNKLFNCYHEGYISGPQTTYGGMSEWIQAFSGSLKLTLIEPTETNALKQTAWEKNEPFIPEHGTSRSFIIGPGQFMIIPHGWIVIRKALQDTYAFSGEFLHPYAIISQLECFESDIYNSNARFNLERDIEIRYLYWLCVGKSLVGNKEFFDPMEINELTTLKFSLQEWRQQFKTGSAAHHTYAPPGIQLSLIIKDLGHLINQRQKRGRGSLKGSKNSINILADQTSACNNPE